MEPPVKRIGDVTIERVPSEKRPKNDTKNDDLSMMTYSSESDSDNPLSDDDDTSDFINSEFDYNDKQLSPNSEPTTSSTFHIQSIKRKSDFDGDILDPIPKKIKNRKSINPENRFDDEHESSDNEIHEDDDDEELLNLHNISELSIKSENVSASDDKSSISRTRLQSENEDSEYDSEEESDTEDPMQNLKPGVVIKTEKTDFIENLASELGESSCAKSEDDKVDTSDYNYDIAEKLKEMGEISVETVKKGDKTRKSETGDGVENEISVTPAKKDSGSDSDDKNSSERKIGNMRRNIREVMDETQLDEATLAAQRQEMERLRRVQEQQRIIREVQRQIALNRQNQKTQHRVISLLQGNSSLIKQIPGTSGSSTSISAAGSSTMGTAAGRIGGTVLVKLPNGETKPMTRITKGTSPFEVVRLQKGALQAKVQRNLIPIKKTSSGNLTPSVSIAPVIKKIEPKSGDTDSESEVSDSERKIRKVAGKQKDVVTISSSSDDDCIVLSEEEPDEPEPDEDPCNSGMHTNDAYNVPDEQGRVLINVGHPEDEAEIFLAPQISRVIKPHQIGGVRFLFDNVIESTERFSTSTGFGCILAHSMGLGKTLQVVCFSDIFLRHTNAKTILCIMPINTLQNWLAEYNMWLPKDPSNSPLLSHGEVRPRNFNLFVLNDSHKTLTARAKVIQEWNKDGGVLLIGYELYRLLSLRRNTKPKPKRKKPAAVVVAEEKETPEEDEKNKSLFEEIHEALVKPGPDLVICDEGHRIKNSHASISLALKQIRSKRRIVLTGYPLQNNLLEYWCMVDFVRPNYLGTKTEFSNMFERPIQNGQCIDSTPQDIRLMRYRAHVLHSLLEGFVQRRSHAVLQTSLPQKEEYVLLVRMTEFQRKLYDTFMNEVVRTKTVPNPLKAFAVCCKIWNHPDVLYYFLKKQTTGETVDLDLEEVAAAGAAAGSVPAKAATPKKRSSRAKGGAKKEKKTAASKNANANSKPAASVTPNTNATTTVSNTSPTITNPVPVPNIPADNPPPTAIPNNANAPQNPPNPPPNYNQMNQNYPNTSYPNSPYQNYQQYPQNGDYYNPNQNFPNPSNYNQGYYPNQEYGGFYDSGNKPEGYMQPYQQDNQQQNYWNAGGNNPQQQNPQHQQYYNQNGPQGDYFGNMNQQPGYGNQDYFRQNQYNQNYPQNNMYPQNANSYQQNQPWPQQLPPSQPSQQPQQMDQQSSQQMPDFNNKSEDMKQDFKSDFKPEYNSEFKQDFNPMMKQDSKEETMKSEMDKSKTEENMNTKENTGEEKKSEMGTNETKEETDDKDKEAEKSADIALAKVPKEDSIPYDWAHELMKGYVAGCIENSAKMQIFFCILQESMALGDRILLFSQSLFTLNLIEEFLQRSEVPGLQEKWAKNKHYYRLDGSTSALEREKLINEYNSNPNIHLFLVSTRAGSLGINLVGANRVIVFDASWNPCHDTQAVCRVYRYGQKKPCFVYRIVMDNCLEKKIYDRQINKQGMADRVVDECNPDAHLSIKDVTNLCWDDEQESEVKDFSTTKDKYIDVVIQKVLDAFSARLSKEPFQHESLLIDRKEKKLSQAEKRLAKRSYELEKQANINSRPTYSYYNTGSGQGLQIRAIRNQDGVLQNKPVASVRPMQSEQMVRDLGRPGAGRSRWIPAEVWQRQGMTAQEMTLPLDVVIPTNSPDRGSIVLKAGQKVLVLKSPKGIYMQLECGKIVAIKTAFKVRGGKAPEKGEEGGNKDHSTSTTILKKVPQGTSKNLSSNVPLPLKNNSAITVIPKGGQQRMVKPFTQGVTKLNMRSIRQPIPNLVGRQIPMRMGGPRFTGKIQSIQRKVQLAKAKPYNLDKIGDNLIPIDPRKIKCEPTDSEPDPHVVPSSDEEIPVESHTSETSDKKDDSHEERTDPEHFQQNEMYSESEKSMETCSDLDRMSNSDYPETSMDRRQSIESYPSPEKSSDNFTNLNQFSNQDKFVSNEHYQNADNFNNPDIEQFPNRERYENSNDKFQNQEYNQEKFQASDYQNPNVDNMSDDKFEHSEKYPNQELRYQQLSDKFSGPEKCSNSSTTVPDKYPNTEMYPATDKYSMDKYSPSPPEQPIPERFPDDQYENNPTVNKFSAPPTNYQNTDRYMDYDPKVEKYPQMEQEQPANLTPINLPSPNLTPINLPSPNLTPINLPSPNLTPINLPSPNLAPINLPSPNLPPSHLTSSNLPPSNLSALNIISSNLVPPNLSSPNLHTPILPPPNLHTSNLPLPNLHTSNLPVSSLHTSTLPPSNLHTSNLPSSNLLVSNLSQSNLHPSNLPQSNLHPSNVSPPNLHPSNVSSPNLHSSNVSPSNLHSYNVSSPNLHSSNVSAANLHSSNVSPSNLRPPNLHSPTLLPSNLISLNLPQPQKEVKPEKLSVPPIMSKSKPVSTNYANPIPNPPLPISSPVVTQDTGNTKRSLKNYRHNFASQKAHNQGGKPTKATSSALHQLEQTTCSIGENKQPFQESLDIITNSYGANLSSSDSKQSENSSNIIDLDADKDDNKVLEKICKTSSSKPSHQTIQILSNIAIPSDQLKSLPPLHHITQPSVIKPDLHQQSPHQLSPHQQPHHIASPQQPQHPFHQQTSQHPAPQQSVPQQLTPQQPALQQLAPQLLTAQEPVPQQLAQQHLAPQQMPPHQMPPHQMPPHQMPPHQMPPQQMPPQQVPSQQVPPQQVPPQQVPPQQVPPQQVPPQQVPPQLVPPQQVPPQQLPPQQMPPQQMLPQQILPPQMPPQQMPPQQLPPQQMPPQQIPPQMSAPQMSAPQLSAPQLSSPQQSAPQLSAPQQLVPQQQQPGPQQVVPHPQHPMQPLHQPHHQLQHNPPPHGHGHQQDFGGTYGGYYGYGTPHVQPYPPPPQPYYNPTDVPPQYPDAKPKAAVDKPLVSSVSQTSTNSRSEPIQSSTSTSSIIPSTPTLSTLSTPSPISTPHHTPAPSVPYSNVGSIATSSSASINSNSANVTTNTVTSASSTVQPSNLLPPPPPVTATPTPAPAPAPTPAGFAPYGQPGMPPPPSHGAYDMMGYPQQNQYSANYPGLPYPNQPNYQPPYQAPAVQYDPAAAAAAAAYPPGPAPPPNMYSAFHRPDVHHHQYGTDPYAQPHYAAAVRNAYPPQYAYPPPPAAQNVYGAAPTPGPAPGYDYQYNANAFPPPPPFVNPYAGLPNNNPVP